jgi:protein SCO1/2
MPFMNRNSRSLLLLGISLVAVVAVAGFSWFFWLRPEPYEFKGGFYNPPNPAASLGDVVDQNGQPFSLEAQRGKVVMLYFGYTHCPDACPATLNEFMEVKERLGDDADQVVFAMVTVDPERDTPERLAEYLDFFDSSFYGLSTNADETRTVARDWNVTYQKREVDSATGYLVDHATSSYVVDQQGNLRLTYPVGFDTGDMTSDIEHLIDEGA